MGDRDRSPRRDRRSGGGGGGSGPRQPADRRIFVSNLPFETKWQDIKDLFRKEVGEVSYVKLFNDENEKPRGAGVLEFASASMAKKAIDKMHRYSMGGRNIVVKEDFDAERDQYGRIVKGSGGGGGGRGGGSSGGSRSGSTRRSVGPPVGSGGQGNLGSTFGLSPQFLDSLDINTSLNNRVFVANLAYEVDERKLRDVFKLAGRVVTVELSRDKEGKSRGFAVVTFDHPVESVQAISMLHNQVLFDRRMSVRLDKLQDESERRDPNSLPDGLSGVGMGLGTGGQPLTDVAKNLPSSGVDMAAMGNMGGMGGGGGGMGGGPTMGTNTNMGANMAGNNAGGQAAIQAALASIATMVGLGAGAMGNNGTANMGAGNVGGGNMGGGNMGNMGGANMSGGNMGGSNMGGGNMGGGNMGGGNMGSSNMGGGNMGGGNMGGGNMSGGNMGNMGSGNMGGGMGDGGMNDHRGGSNVGMGRGGGRTSDTVIVKNLPFNCNWQALKDGFRHIADIKFAEIKDRGVGIVKFNSERDADKAVQMMDRQRIQGDIINVGLF